VRVASPAAWLMAASVAACGSTSRDSPIDDRVARRNLPRPAEVATIGA